MEYNFEKVNPKHPDKIADRIAGAIVDLAYKYKENPIVAVEVLIGHNACYVINETDTHLDYEEVLSAVYRISGVSYLTYDEVGQDSHLADNQKDGLRCGDNGIFKGCPVTPLELNLAKLAYTLYSKYYSDGKYIISANESDPSKPRYVICQSNADSNEIRKMLGDNAAVNPLGEWTGGTDVDTGATNRKLGSDMGLAVTGGGLHGKDLSKADVAVNIYAYLKAQHTGQEVNLSCAIGDSMVDGKPYSEIVEIAREYINSLGGFEKFAEWGLIRFDSLSQMPRMGQMDKRESHLSSLCPTSEMPDCPRTDTRPKFAREIPEEKLKNIPKELFKEDIENKGSYLLEENHEKSFRFSKENATIYLSRIFFEKNGKPFYDAIPASLTFETIQRTEYKPCTCNLGGDLNKYMLRFRCVKSKSHMFTPDNTFAVFTFYFDGWYVDTSYIVSAFRSMLEHWDGKICFGFKRGEIDKAVKAFRKDYESNLAMPDINGSIEDKI